MFKKLRIINRNENIFVLFCVVRELLQPVNGWTQGVCLMRRFDLNVRSFWNYFNLNILFIDLILNIVLYSNEKYRPSIG